MNHHIDPVKTGLAVGKMLGGIHLLWAILIAIGWAQPLLTFILWAHMITAPVTVNRFDFSAAITLVLLTAAIGYVLGYLFAKSSNWLHRRP